MRTVLTTLLLAFFLIQTTEAQPGPPDHARPVEGVILVKFAPDALETPPQQLRPNELDLQGRQAARLRQLLNVRRGPGQKLFRNFTPADTLGRHRQTDEHVRLKDLSRWYRIPVRDTTNVVSLASHFRELPIVLKATPDYSGQGASSLAPPRTVPNDILFDDQWGFDDPSDDSDVDAPEAWSLQTGRSDITVAVLDGGVDLDHPDLVTDDGSRLTSGYDFANDDSVPEDDLPSGSATNFDDHGTPVAGTIGARTNNNQTGVAGMMWDLTIMPLKIAKSDGKTSKYSTWAQAVDYARENGADVINISGGGDFPHSGHPLNDAFYNAHKSGLVSILSTGNDGNSSVEYPAVLQSTIAVGATDDGDDRHVFSNYGKNLDLVAPSGFQATSRGKDGDLYEPFGGTSHSAPIVSGIAGLLFSESRDEDHNLSNNDVRHLMEETADDVNASQFPGRDNRVGHGRVNAHEALRLLNENEVVHGSLSFNKIADDVQYDMRSSGPWPYGSGIYIVDVWEMKASANFSFREKPLFWLPVPEKGITASSPNDGSRWMDKSVSKTSGSAKTFFLFVESAVDGRQIGWYPFDPTAFKHNGSFRWTAIGDPATTPVDVTISGPSSLNSGGTGTWTASVDGGSRTLSYQWYEKYDADNSFSPISGATSASYSAAYEGNVTLKAEVTADNGSDSDTHAVNVDCEPTCVESLADTRKRNATVSATATAETVEVTWQVPSPPRGSRFVVQHRPDSTAAWSTIGSVPASDSLRADSASGPTYRHRTDKLEIGTHQFRVSLPQDGGGKARAVGRGHSADARRYAGPVTARIAMDEAYRFSAYPNPVRNQATVELAVRESQDVQVRLYDVLGRRVRTLRSGPLPAQKLQRLRLDVSADGLTSGTYFLRVTGEDVAATEQITVVR